MDFMTLIQTARSVRRFKQTPINMSTLETLIDYARQSPSGANQQRLKYMAVNDLGTMALIFPLIKWAGALKDWDGPMPGQRPTAYIVVLLDRTLGVSPGIDHGIAAQSIRLGACAMGLGMCIIGAFDKSLLSEKLRLPDTLEPLLILSLGEPGEEVIIDVHEAGASLAYFRDQEDRHHVPKRSLEDVMWTGQEKVEKFK